MPIIISVLLAVICLRFHDVPHANRGYGFLCLSLFYLLAAARHTSVGGAIVLCMMPLYLLIDKKVLLNAFHNYTILLACFLVPSFIMYILVTFLSLPISYVEIQSLNELKDYSYLQYPLLLVDTIERGLIVTRFHAIFDEPGVIGSFAAVVLWMNGFELKKWYNLVLFISGIFAFSLFFYLICIIYVALYSKLKIKLAILLFLVIVAPVLVLKVPDLQTLIFHRFEVKNGVWAGNSRSSDAFQVWYESFKNSDAYWFGLGAGSNLIYNKGGASYKDIIVNYGILSFLLYCLSWVLLSFSKKHLKYTLLSSLIILMFLFQRPFYFDPFILLMFLYCAYYTSFQEA